MRWTAWLAIALAGAASGCAETEPPAHLQVFGGDVTRGKAAIERVACGVCHVIPRVNGPNGVVGPSLERFGRRALIAGRIPNTPTTLAQFVRDAPSLAPSTAMPELPIDEQEARDIAAFLYSLR